MAPQASSVVPMSLETGPEQRPASPLALAEPPAGMQQIPRPLQVAECAMCGMTLPLAFLVPDGGQACADIRWYCKDARSCTERWTTARPPQHAHTAPANPGITVAGAREVFPDAALAKPLGGILKLAEHA
jgi:hypothetical protein